jgi:hypothetical protein
MQCQDETAFLKWAFFELPSFLAGLAQFSILLGLCRQVSSKRLLILLIIDSFAFRDDSLACDFADIPLYSDR